MKFVNRKQELNILQEEYEKKIVLLFYMDEDELENDFNSKFIEGKGFYFLQTNKMKGCR